MKSDQQGHDRHAGGTLALCTAATSSMAGIYMFTQSVLVTIVAAVVMLGMATVQTFAHH